MTMNVVQIEIELANVDERDFIVVWNNKEITSKTRKHKVCERPILIVDIVKLGRERTKNEKNIKPERTRTRVYKSKK